MILLIDNYDSFTWNLVHLAADLGEPMQVHRNDEIAVGEVLALSPRLIILSPGPCTPDKAGICLDLAAAAIDREIPLLGVCLGHQAIAQAMGARIGRAGRLMHGKVSQVTHDGDALFAGLPSPFAATRYHSLVAVPDTVSPPLEVIARASDDGEIMAVRVTGKPAYGVQFHPESIASEYGLALLQNVMRATRRMAA